MTTKRAKTAHKTARPKRRLLGATKLARARSSDVGEITSKPMLIGYARVSTVDQNLALQRDALTEAGCQKIFTEQISGAVADRPALHDALECARSGDTLIVWKLDRLARSMKQLIETLENLRVRGVGFRSLTEALDTTTAQGRLVFHMFGALAEFERSLIRERTRAGLATFAEGITRDFAAVHAALTEVWSTGPVEGHINRLKMIKRQMYGRAHYDLLRKRVLAAA